MANGTSVNTDLYTLPSMPAAGTEKKTGAAQTLGKDEFLQLMIAQLKNQDPLDPVKNEAYIAQLATFSSLEQLVAIKEGVNKLAGVQAAAE